MNSTILICLVAAFFVLAGCTGSPDNVETTSDVQPNGSGSFKQTITNDEGTTTITGTASGDSWCQAGSNWQMTHTGEDAGAAQMVIVGIESSGKYAGMCHVTYDLQSEETNMEADYYFDEDGNGYQVMNINGQTMESEWTS